jgi:hypothetical protein
MSNYPHLTEMGILNPQEIEKFAIYSTDNVAGSALAAISIDIVKTRL